jgi:hypothetical protein
MPTDREVDEIASILFAAALAFTNSIGRKGWSWEACDAQTQHYWRNIARMVWKSVEESMRPNRE